MLANVPQKMPHGDETEDVFPHHYRQMAKALRGGEVDRMRRRI